MQVTAIVVARGGSQRVKGKALRPFGTSTLVGHKVDQLKACAMVDTVVVGSDDIGILREAEAHGAETVVRDAYHCDESQCTANEMIYDMAVQVEGDVILWAHPTNPLCMPDIYDRAVRDYMGLHDVFDSLCSGFITRRHAWSRSIPGEYPKPINFDPWGSRHPLASELDEVFYQDGAIFIQPRAQMIANRYFYGRTPQLFVIEAPYNTDIDTEMDLHIARAIYDAMADEMGQPRGRRGIPVAELA